MSKVLAVVAVLGGLVALGSVLPEDDPEKSSSPAPVVTTAAPAPSSSSSPSPEAGSSPSAVAASSVPTPSPARTSTSSRAPLLYAAAGGDGDSWKDRQGREYRMGLVNTPEYDECYGSVATAKRKSMVRDGFRAAVYTNDAYGRRVAVITTAAGVNLNVYLARHGYANDTYLSTYRHENPSLANKLDAAFAAAKREKAGLWGACSSGGSTSPGTTGSTSSSCHPDYRTCIPIQGDGSGQGQENDLDCGEIGKPVYLRQAGIDPYRLDADGDGVGCDD